MSRKCFVDLDNFSDGIYVAWILLMSLFNLWSWNFLCWSFVQGSANWRFCVGSCNIRVVKIAKRFASWRLLKNNNEVFSSGPNLQWWTLQRTKNHFKFISLSTCSVNQTTSKFPEGNLQRWNSDSKARPQTSVEPSSRQESNKKCREGTCQNSFPSESLLHCCKLVHQNIKCSFQ